MQGAPEGCSLKICCYLWAYTAIQVCRRLGHLGLALVQTSRSQSGLHNVQEQLAKQMVHVFELATNKVLPHVVGSLTTGIRRRAGAEAETDTRSATSGMQFVLYRMRLVCASLC